MEAAEAFRAGAAGVGLRPADEKCGPVPPPGRRDRALPSGLAGPSAHTRPRGGASAAPRGGASRLESIDLPAALETAANPFEARRAVASISMSDRSSRSLLRAVRVTHPDLAGTAAWGLSR